MQSGVSDGSLNDERRIETMMREFKDNRSDAGTPIHNSTPIKGVDRSRATVTGGNWMVHAEYRTDDVDKAQVEKDLASVSSRRT